MKRPFAIALVILFLLLSRSPQAWAQSGNVTISTDTSWPAGTYHLDHLTVTNGATLTLQGANTSATVNDQWAGYGVTIYATSIDIDGDSRISADGQGYLGGPTGGNGRGPGGGGGSILYDSAGGSYGGLGSSSATLNAGPIYGSALMPTDLGSGGGGTTWCAGGVCAKDPAGGNGGGAIRLIVTGTLTNNGLISANGMAAPPNWPPSPDTYAFAGAGGSIWVTAGELAGAGTMTANGGPHYWGGQLTPNGGGGGGGRIAVYFGANNYYSGYETTTALGGPGAQNGTVGFINTTNNDLFVFGGQTFIYGEDSSLVFHDIDVDTGSTLIVGGGSTINAGGSVTVAQNANLVLQSKNTTAQVNGVWAGQGVTLSAVNINVNVGGAITAAGQGYKGGATGASGRGPGGGWGSTLYGSAGGSHGGLGYSPDTTVGPTYGDSFTPIDLGSGGGGATRCAGGTCASDPAGGNGGGAMRLIVTGTLMNNGTISAEGAAAPPNWPPSLDTYACGGAGGSIWATLGDLAGSGLFTANGGQHYWNGVLSPGGGGGGRIALYYYSSSFAGSATANGGIGAQPGTVAFFSTSGNDLEVTGGQTFVIPPDTTPTFGNITVQNGSTLIVGGGTTLNVNDLVWVTSNSRIVVQGKNTAWQVNNQWAGQGATISAKDVIIDAGSAISADALGYTGGQTGQPGNGPGGGVGTTFYDSAGGSYGGLGANTSCCTAGPTYGSSSAPVDLGSGAGGAGNSPGGAGGGAIRLIVSGSLANDGLISANGGNGGTYSGGGSGGSIWANVGSLTGSGSITADGGSRIWDGTPAAAGGGGGRIALYYVGSLAYGSMQANGGVGAQAGTVQITQLVSTYVTTVPSGLEYTVDGTAYKDMHYFEWLNGTQHTIAITSPQPAAGFQYVFNHWSDHGSESHYIFADFASTAYVAYFDVQHFPPSAVSVTPSAGGGSNRVFNFTFSDPMGSSAITATRMLINTTADAANSCLVAFTPSTRTVALADDAGTGYGPALTIGAASTLQNTQCSINVGASSATDAGNNLSVRLALTFNPMFGGSKNVYMYAENSFNLNSGWQAKGTWLVPGTITVTGPNGGESWPAGTAHSIQWNAIGVSGDVLIALLKAGTGYKAITTVPATQGTYTWTIPTTIPVASDYTIRVMSASYGAVLDVSNAPFAITPGPSITVVSPNGSESWAAGSAHAIQWNAVSMSGDVLIALLKAGTGYKALATVPAVAGTYNWTIPTTIPVASDYTIRVMSAGNGAIVDVSNAPFAITPGPSVTVVSPNGAENWAAGTTHSIQWNAINLTGDVKIALLKGGTGYMSLATVPAASGTHNWTIPMTVPLGSDYTIRVMSAANGTILDISNAPFTISAGASITVLSPNGGESWQTGTTHAIQWNAVSLTGDVKIALMKSGSGYMALATVPATQGTYNWTIPANVPVGSDYTIRVMSASYGTLLDVSNAPFTITKTP